MKFLVVFLALVACAAAFVPQERGLIEDKVRSIVDNAIAEAQADIATVKADIDSLTSSFKTRMASIISAAKTNVSSFVSNAQSTISGVIAKGGAIATCAQSALSDLNTSTFVSNVETCAVTTVDFEAQVVDIVAELTEGIASLTEIYEECTAGFFDAVECAFTKVGQVKDAIEDIVDGVKGAISIADGNSNVKLSQVTTCTQQVVSEATTGINKIVSAAKACA